MKVLIYAGGTKVIKISGIGCAVSHQKQALSLNGVEYTTDKKSDYDILHINTYGLFSKLMAKKAKKQGKVVVYHAHSTEEDFRNSFIFSNTVSKIFKKWLISCYEIGDVIITPTEYSKNLLLGYGIKKPIYAVSNGIDIDFYKKAETDKEDFLKRFNLSSEDKTIISVGLFIKRKGILDFIKMAKALPQYKFIWFGKTPSFSIPREIKKAVKNAPSNLTFAGFVPAPELKKAYTSADLFLFMTHEETEGIVLLEALASKQNVLIRDIPIYEPFENGKDLYKGKDFDELKRYVQDIVEGKLPDITQNGYETIKDKDITLIGKQLKQIYEDCLNNKN